MKRNERYIKLCLKKAAESKVSHYKHFACVVKGGRVISTGINKNKAGCLGDSVYEFRHWHSELDALCKLTEDQIKNSILFVAGWTKGGNIVKSKPCKHCQEYLKRYDLKAVYYSLPDGSYEKLSV